MIRWFAHNGIAANFLGGLYTAFFRVPLEVTPSLSWNTVMIEMPYRGATAKDVERAILIPIEQALEGVQGIRHLHADGHRGFARFYLQAKEGADVRALMDDVRARVDTITTFPNETERPRISIPESRNYIPVLNVAVTGHLGAHDLRRVARRVQDDLLEIPGINTAWAAINYNQHELEISLRPRAAELGLTQWLLARQIRQAFYGEEAQRVQRGVDDIRVMVRLPREARETLHTLEQLKIRTPSGVDVPLATVAEITFVKAPSFVERNDRAEVIRIGAQPADETVDVIGIARDITPRLLELCRGAENLSFEFKGHVAEAAEARKRTLLGGAALLLVLYGMLAIPFRSLLQPIYVLLAVPFSVIGALLGHILLGITPSYLSIFGMLALAGVAVNDSLVLIDYINRRRREGIPLRQAALEAGARRFRPILLTSATTFAALAPLMISPSLHAQFLIPMAVSLGFGVVFATTITLFLVPCALLLAEDAGQVARRLLTWYAAPLRRSGAAVDLTASEVDTPSAQTQ